MNDSEKTKIVQAQDEEQLQAITGGCGICEASLIEAGKLQNSASSDINKVQQNPSRADANLLLNRAAQKLSSADLLHRAIIASGHVDISKLPKKP